MKEEEREAAQIAETSCMLSPKLFISYSWSSPDHEKWVLALAEELLSQGIDVKLDKWDLKPGHDANAFMESMVTDPAVNKVLLIFDRQYAEKSNKRMGGAGAEAQIITPELYAKREQDKFVAVIRERDDEGKPYLPVYYRGRIYIDLSDDSIYATEFEKLLRWAWDKPVFVKPELGQLPAFLAEEGNPVRIATTTTFRRALDAIRNARPNSIPTMVEYFNTLASELERFRISYNGPEFDELVAKNIEDFLPFRNEFIEVVSAIAMYRCQDDMFQAVQRFFEKLIPYLEKPDHINSWRECDFDNYRFIVHELFLYTQALLIKHEHFDAASFFIETNYFFDNRMTGVSMHPYTAFRTHVRSLDDRNQRLKLGRLSLHADLLKERNKASGVDFRYLMAADLILYLRSVVLDPWPWWPTTLVFTTFRGVTFEMFARAKSARYFDRIKGLLGVKDKPDLNDLLTKIESEQRQPTWLYHSINPRALIQFDDLASSP